MDCKDCAFRGRFFHPKIRKVPLLTHLLGGGNYSSGTKPIKSNLGRTVKPNPNEPPVLPSLPTFVLSPFCLTTQKPGTNLTFREVDHFLPERRGLPDLYHPIPLGPGTEPQGRPADCHRFGMPQSLAFADISFAPRRSGFAPSK